jgi:two-component sensor histidine kinase
MSLIHQKLYQSEDIKTIDMKEYLPEFIQYLDDSFDTSNQVRFQLDIEPIKLSAAQAIPIGLIINEAVTNSIKYAFPDNRPGEIMIELHQAGEQVSLSVTDNGIGIDPSWKGADFNSLGIELMKGLSREIKGEIVFKTNKGTRITVLFDADLLNEHRTLIIPSKEKEVAI